jgi:hypothetical protein
MPTKTKTKTYRFNLYRNTTKPSRRLTAFEVVVRLSGNIVRLEGLQYDDMESVRMVAAWLAHNFDGTKGGEIQLAGNRLVLTPIG